MAPSFCRGLSLLQARPRAALEGNAFLRAVTDFSSFVKYFSTHQCRAQSQYSGHINSALGLALPTFAQASCKLYFASFQLSTSSAEARFQPSWNGSILTLLHSRPSLLKRLSSFFTPTYRLVASIRSTLYVIGRYVREQALRARFRGDDPDDSSFSYSADQVPTWVQDFFRVLKSCIGQLEILAVLFAYMTLPKQITPAKHVTSDRLVLHYIDNTSLIAGAIKGYSSRPDSSKLLTLTILHIIFSILKTAPWFAARYLKLIDWLASVHAPSQAPRDSGARARNAELASRRVFARAPRESGLDH